MVTDRQWVNSQLLIGNHHQWQVSCCFPIDNHHCRQVTSWLPTVIRFPIGKHWRLRVIGWPPNGNQFAGHKTSDYVGFSKFYRLNMFTNLIFYHRNTKKLNKKSSKFHKITSNPSTFSDFIMSQYVFIKITKFSKHHKHIKLKWKCHKNSFKFHKHQKKFHLENFFFCK